MRRMALILFPAALALGLCLLAGCAGLVANQGAEQGEDRVRFGEFKKVELKGASLTESFSEIKGSGRQLQKIDEFLVPAMMSVFPDLVVIEPGQDFSTTPERTLQITPVVKELRTAASGAASQPYGLVPGSDILLRVSFRDSASGKVIAAPEFYRSAGTPAPGENGGGIGGMFKDLAADVVKYCRKNL